MQIAHLLSARTSNRTGSPSVYGSDRLPALNTLINTVPNPGSIYSLIITHILRTAIGYIEAINKAFPIVKIVAVPYSADPESVNLLKSKGFDVYVPESVGDTFIKAKEIAIAALSNSNKPLVIQEVGGYLAGATSDLHKYSHFTGIVEDTNNGHWRYERFSPHKCPVLSMAQSPLKGIEDTIIGDATLHSIERVLREHFTAIIEGSRIAVIGYGKIGSSTAIAFKGREAVVSVYDINPARNIRAKVEGFFPLPLHVLLSEAELIIGCTGQTSIRAVDMEYIKDGAILVSASSKDVEFALKDFSCMCSNVEDINDVVRRYTQYDGRIFYVLNRGTPINFRDGSILGTILDLIYCEIFACIREVAKGRVSEGLHKSPPEIQNEVAKLWLQQHSDTFFRANDDKVWTYPDSLRLK